MWNAGLDEAQGGIKIARRNINNLRKTTHPPDLLKTMAVGDTLKLDSETFCLV